MKKSLFVIAMMMLLNACQVHTVRLGNPNIYHEPNSPENVAVYYKQCLPVNIRKLHW